MSLRLADLPPHVRAAVGRAHPRAPAPPAKARKATLMDRPLYDAGRPLVATRLREGSAPAWWIPVTPMGAVRLSRRDHFRPSAYAGRYFAWKDAVRLACEAGGFELPAAGLYLVAFVPMPPSWSRRKRAELDGMPHQQKPDWDNIGKALQDAIAHDDAHVWDARVQKFWTADPVGGMLATVLPVVVARRLLPGARALEAA